jgi:hypothetical protein
MPREDFKATKITVGREGNTISKHPDGDMLLTDAFVSVKLKELLGGSVVIDPAIYVEIEATDWTEVTVDGQTRYNVDIPHNWNICDPLVSVETWNMDDELIQLNTVKFKTNSIFLQSTLDNPMKVVLKKL